MLNLNRQEKTGCYFYGKEGSRVTIGDKIKALRTERGMSQDAVASALSVTRQAVAKWESNQSVPRVVSSTISRFAFAGRNTERRNPKVYCQGCAGRRKEERKTRRNKTHCRFCHED